MAPVIRWIGIIVFGLGCVSAQEATRVIGYCDVADPRTRSTGMATALKAAARAGVRLEKFELGRPSSFRPETWDALFFPSFVEMTPGWSAFARRESTRVLALAERGGLVVFFARYRKSDTGEEADVPKVPRIEPPGWNLRRSKTSPKGVYLDLKGHPIWDGVGGRGDRSGLAMVRNTRMAGQKRFAADPFDRWKRGLNVGVWTTKDRRGDALALHGPLGSRGGEVWYLQMTLDKVDGPSSDKSEALSKRLFANLTRRVAQRPRVSRPAAPRPKPRPENRPPAGDPEEKDERRETPPVAPPRPSALLTGRVFRDANGDGVRQSTETGFAAARLSDLVRELRADGAGNYRLEITGQAARAVVLTIPDGQSLTRADADWWASVRPVAGGRTRRVDFALRPMEDPDRGLAIALRLAAPKNAAEVDASARTIMGIVTERRPDLIFVLAPKFSAALEERLDRALRSTVAGAGVDLRWVADQGRRRVDELRPGRFTRQPLRSARTIAGHGVVVLAAPESRDRAPAWSRWLSLHSGADVFASGVVLEPAQRAAVAKSARIIEPGDASRVEGNRVELSPLRSARGPWAEFALTRGAPVEVRLVGASTKERGQEGGEESPTEKPVPAPILPTHPLIGGDLEKALREARGG